MKKTDRRNFFSKTVMGIIGLQFVGISGLKIFSKKRVPTNIKITESRESIKRIK
ncbi:MAG: hypothetical protein Fur0015_12780 [Ignavibacteriales bacterium]